MGDNQHEINETQKSESGSDQEQEIKLSEKGIRMAKIVGEYILMRYFFPGVTDKRKQTKLKDIFFDDM
jgi:hypothetical protein